MHLWEGETSKLITPWYPINNNLGGLNHISKIYGGGGGSGGVWGGGGREGGMAPGSSSNYVCVKTMYFAIS